jgi:hypothetical protein
MKQPMNTANSAVDGVIGVHLLYKDIFKFLGKERPKGEIELQRASQLGMAWGYTTGESKNVGFGTTLAVSGIHNVMSLLEEVERGELKDVDFIELQACLGGCIGGPLNINNLFVGRVRMRELIKRVGVRSPYYNDEIIQQIYNKGHFKAQRLIEPRKIMALDEDVMKALIKMERLEQITEELPGLDCGACGSPSCRALAEDMIRGVAFETDCVIKLRERVKALAEEILDLARIVPPVMADTSNKTEKKQQQT